MYHYSLQQFKKKKKKSNLGEGENLISMGNIIVKCPISKKKKKSQGIQNNGKV